jgi:hypothetical protein
LEAKWDKAPKTGFKLGMAASRVLVKRVGVPGKTEYQEEVWVTGSVWERLAPNDYIAYSCGCQDIRPRDSLWDEAEITRLPEGDEDRYGRKLTSMWCEKHGSEFCNAILAGKTARSDVAQARSELAKKLVENVNAQKRKRAKQQRVARLGAR